MNKLVWDFMPRGIGSTWQRGSTSRGCHTRSGRQNMAQDWSGKPSIRKAWEIFQSFTRSFFLLQSFFLFFSYNQPSLSKEVFRMRRGPGVPWPESHPSFRDALLPVWTVLEDVVSSTLHHICLWAGISSAALLQECGEDPTQHETKVISPFEKNSSQKDL